MAEAGLAGTLFAVNGALYLAVSAAMVALALALAALRFNEAAVRAFAVLLLLRALGSGTYTLGQLASDPAAAQLWWRVTPYFVLPLASAAVAFALWYPSPARRAAAWTALVAVLTLAVEGLYLVDHALFWDLAAPGLDARGPQDGAPAGPLFAAYGAFVLAYAAVALRCARASARAPPGPRRDTTRLVAIGFGTVAVYDGVGLLVLAPDYVLDRPAFVAAALALSLGGAIALAVAAAATLLRRAGADADARRGARVFAWSLVAAAVSVAVAALTPRGTLLGYVVAQSFSIAWRLALPALVAYALLRYRLFGIELRLRWTVERGTVAGVFVVVFLVVAEIAQEVVSAAYGWAFGGLAAGLLLFAVRPLERVAHRVAEAALPGVRASPEYFGYRKLAIYRAAVEGAWADGRVTEGERGALDALRRELGILAEDAFAVERDVERAVAG